MNIGNGQIAKTKGWYSNGCSASSGNSSPSPIVPLASNINMGPE